MALINCSECQREVSDKAASCPQCGAPIANKQEAKAAGTQISTVQETSKKFKLHTLLSVFAICIGVVWMLTVSSNPYEDSSASATPVLLIFFGFIWYLITRFRIWWHHK